MAPQSTEPSSPEQAAFLADQLARINETRQPALYATVSVCIFIAYISVFLRLLARRINRQPLQADDWWMIAALVPTTVWDAFNYWSIRAGLGLHIIRVTNIKPLIQSSVGCMILYALCIPPIKFSLLFLYRRIFPSKKIKHIGAGIGLVVAGAGIASSVAFGLQCIPLSSLWSGGQNQCINLGALSTSTGVINIVTDVAILCLPIRPLIHLQASTKVRVGLVATFLLGGCVCIFSIIRAKVVGQSSQVDPSWNNAIGGIWSLIEVHVGIVSANIPVLRPLFVMSRFKNKNPSAAVPKIRSSGYIQSGDSKKRKGIFSFTNNSLWDDTDDSMALQVVEGEVQPDMQISKKTDIDVDVQSQGNTGKQHTVGSLF